MSERKLRLPRIPARSSRLVAIVGVTVIPMTGPERLPDHTVVVENGRITAVGPRTVVDTTIADYVDGRGKFLFPGLVDSHAPLVDFRDSVLFLATGTTRIRHMFGYPEHMANARLVDGSGHG
ncbi:MAG: hypothetical protein ACREP9_07575 [Candidatus Dormibacteraceae bacterium]